MRKGVRLGRCLLSGSAYGRERIGRQEPLELIFLDVEAPADHGEGDGYGRGI